MSMVFVRVKPTREPYKPEIVFDGARNHAYGIPTEKFNAETGTTIMHTFFEVDNRDIDAALRDLTQNHPGCEVEVLEVIKSAVRPAGDIVIKNVTKDGVLP